MKVSISKDFPKEANKGFTAIAVTLKEVFKSYEQQPPAVLNDPSEPFVLPIVRYKSKKVYMGKGKRQSTCDVRLVAYSKSPKDEKPCLRFVHAHCTRDKETTLKEILPAVRDASFDEGGEHTVLDLLSTLGGIKADKISYYYSPCTCDGTTTHSLAVVHEFGPVDNPHCIVTSYFSIKTDKS